MTLLPVFYANRDLFRKMLTLIDFEKKRKLLLLLEKHLSNNDYDLRIFTSSFYIFLIVFILVNGVGLIFLNKDDLCFFNYYIITKESL